MIKAVIFDFDDTLVRTKSIRYKAIKLTAKEFYNISLSDPDIDKYWGEPFESFVYNVFNKASDVEKLIRNYRTVLNNFPNMPYENTNITINELKEKYSLGIISSSSKELILSGMKNVSLDPNLFQFIQSAEDTTVHKPDPSVFGPSLRFYSELSIKRSEIIYVGDSLDDFFASRDANIMFCGVSDRTTSRAQFKKHHARYITNIINLPKFISTLDFGDNGNS